jgi:hypothetical protein
MDGTFAQKFRIDRLICSHVKRNWYHSVKINKKFMLTSYFSTVALQGLPYFRVNDVVFSRQKL